MLPPDGGAKTGAEVREGGREKERQRERVKRERERERKRDRDRDGEAESRRGGDHIMFTSSWIYL
jgi:hypothetical protein